MIHEKKIMHNKFNFYLLTFFICFQFHLFLRRHISLLYFGFSFDINYILLFIALYLLNVAFLETFNDRCQNDTEKEFASA